MSDDSGLVAEHGRLNFGSDVVILTDDPRRAFLDAMTRVSKRPLSRQQQGGGLSRKEVAVKSARAAYASDAFREDSDWGDLIQKFRVLAEMGESDCPKGVRDTIEHALSFRMNLTDQRLRFLRSDARFALYCMWSKGQILLPLSFTLNKSAARGEIYDVTTEIVRFCLDYEGRDDGTSTPFRMVQHVPRVLICTRWARPEDISLAEAVQLHRHLVLRF